MNIKQSIVLICSLFFSFSAMSASKWLGDWFEVEVILLSQLDDKSKLKEIFPDQALLLSRKKSLDLLSDYLHPDITLLKQQLPYCHEDIKQQTLLEQATVWPEFHKIYSLEQLEILLNEELALKALEKQNLYVEGFFEDEVEVEVDQVAQQTPPINNEEDDDFFDRIQTKQEKQLTSNERQTTDNFIQDEIDNNQLNAEIQLIEEASPEYLSITPEQETLVKQAEQAFHPIQFNYSTTMLPADGEKLCTISRENYKALSVDYNRFSYHGFSVDKMPIRINATEDVFSQHPYLISSDGLKLKDIVKKLRLSKNFRPLLHLGWRQPVFESADSTPIRLYAGDNLQHHFKNAFAQFQDEQHIAQQQELALKAAINNGSFDNKQNIEENTPAQLLALQKKQRIKQILTSINNNTDVDAVLNELNQHQPTSITSMNDELTLSPPIAPIQPWFIEGLLDVYLIGNYLNVSADFNMLNLTLAEQESLKLKPDAEVVVKAINLKQNRRMISNEVHYFDHPYMGIIIQIRRHKRPEPPVEEQNVETLTQAF